MTLRVFERTEPPLEHVKAISHEGQRPDCVSNYELDEEEESIYRKQSPDLRRALHCLLTVDYNGRMREATQVEDLKEKQLGRKEERGGKV